MISLPAPQAFLQKDAKQELFSWLIDSLSIARAGTGRVNQNLVKAPSSEMQLFWVIACTLAQYAAAALSANAERLAWLHSAPPLVNETDCLMRSYFIERALEVNPSLTIAQTAAMVDALAGDPAIGQGCIVSAPRQASISIISETTTNSGPVFFCDAVHGNDASDGSLQSPFLTITRGISAVRDAGAGGGTVNLRGGGTFYLDATLALSAADSGLTLQTYPPDADIAWLSGSMPLTNLEWTPVNTTGAANIWRCNISAIESIGSIDALRDNGARLIRARFPNSNPETGLPFLHTNVQAASWTPLPNATHGSSWTANASYSRNDSACSRCGCCSEWELKCESKRLA